MTYCLRKVALHPQIQQLGMLIARYLFPVVCHPELCAFLGQETGEEGWMSGWMEPTFPLSMGLCEREVGSYF